MINFDLGERVDTTIFCSSAVKSSRMSLEMSQPHICVTPYSEQIKDVQSENQAIDNVRSIEKTKEFFKNISFVLLFIFSSQ